MKFIDDFKNDDSIDEIEKTLIKQDDWQLERFINEYGKEVISYNAMIRALKWKKAFGINELFDLNFPREFYEHFIAIKFGRDKNNHVIFWSNPKTMLWTKNMSKDLLHVLKKFIIFNTNRIDKEVGKMGMTYVLDMKGIDSKAFLNKYSSDFVRFTFALYGIYPKLFKYILVIDLPNILNFTVNYLISFNERKYKTKIKFLKREKITEYINDDCILSEARTKILIDHAIPRDSKRLNQFSENEFKFNFQKKFYETYFQINAKTE